MYYVVFHDLDTGRKSEGLEKPFHNKDLADAAARILNINAYYDARGARDQRYEVEQVDVDS